MSVEGFGFLADIVLFGVFMTILQERRERKRTIREYQNLLVDFIPWESQEGVLRKVGIIKRLNEMRAPLPNMWSIHLEKADIERVDLRRASMRSANLQNAKLGGADLEGADLALARLEGAKLQSAILKGADLLEAKLYSADMEEADLRGLG